MKKICTFTIQIQLYEKEYINYYNFRDADASLHRDYWLQMRQ